MTKGIKRDIDRVRFFFYITRYLLNIEHVFFFLCL